MVAILRRAASSASKSMRMSHFAAAARPRNRPSAHAGGNAVQQRPVGPSAVEQVAGNRHHGPGIVGKPLCPATSNFVVGLRHQPDARHESAQLAAILLGQVAPVLDRLRHARAWSSIIATAASALAGSTGWASAGRPQGPAYGSVSRRQVLCACASWLCRSSKLRLHIVEPGLRAADIGGRGQPQVLLHRHHPQNLLGRGQPSAASATSFCDWSSAR